MRKLPMIFAAIVALAAFPHPATAQLLSQRSEGSSRYCTYGPSALPATVRAYNGAVPEGTVYRGGGPQNRIVRVESYEVCPDTYPSWREQRVIVPSMATLVRADRQAGQTYCIYRYLGRSYVVARGQASVCNLTPNGG